MLQTHNKRQLLQGKTFQGRLVYYNSHQVSLMPRQFSFLFYLCLLSPSPFFPSSICFPFDQIGKDVRSGVQDQGCHGVEGTVFTQFGKIKPIRPEDGCHPEPLHRMVVRPQAPRWAPNRDCKDLGWGISVVAGVQLDIRITDWRGVQKQLVQPWRCQGFPNTSSTHRTHPAIFPVQGLVTRGCYMSPSTCQALEVPAVTWTSLSGFLQSFLN